MENKSRANQLLDRRVTPSQKRGMKERKKEREREREREREKRERVKREREREQWRRQWRRQWRVMGFKIPIRKLSLKRMMVNGHTIHRIE